MSVLTLITSAPSSDAEYRTGLISRYLTARSSRTRKALRAEAAAYDGTNPGAPSLTDELFGASLGDVA
jgi:hypothetical protein